MNKDSHQQYPVTSSMRLSNVYLPDNFADCHCHSLSISGEHVLIKMLHMNYWTETHAIMSEQHQ